MRHAALAIALLASSLHAADVRRARPIAFEENRGQADASAAFLARGADHSLLVGEDRAWLQARDGSDVVTLRLVDAAAGALRGDGDLPGVVNDYRGADPSRWVSGARTWERVVRENAWPGIDVVFHLDGSSLEHDVVLQPGADLARVRFALDGAPAPCLESGDLVVATGKGEFRLHRPIAWEGDGTSVEARFVVGQDGSVGFAVDRCDASQALVIDPVVSFASYLGGSDDESVYGVAAAPTGDIAVVGETRSSNFLTASAHQNAPASQPDAFLTRLDPLTGTVRYSTYFGGTGSDAIESVAFDRFGNAYVGGHTWSTDFPTMAAAHGTEAGDQDGFVARFDDAGALVFSTYVGGADEDAIHGVATDYDGNVYVVGHTLSTNFPVASAHQASRAGHQDAIVGRLTPQGAVSWMTYLGGSEFESATAVAAGYDGYIVFTGNTDSPDFPVQNAAQATKSGFVDAFNGAMTVDGQTLFWSTFEGGAGYDYGNDVVRTSGGDTIVVGSTDSPNFPTLNAIDSTFSNGDGFVTKYAFNGTMNWSTLLGGTDGDYANGVGLMPTGDVAVFGNTTSNDFPLVAATQATYAGQGDVFVSQVKSDGTALLFSTYVGGASADSALSGTVDWYGFMSFAGSTFDTGFPTVSPIQATFGSAAPGVGADGIVGTLSPGSANDLDADGVVNASDNCSRIANPTQDNRDLDAIGDACDNCELYANATQADSDGDTLGDACEFAYGDVAPLGAPNGTLDVADVVFALRTSVGLETPTTAQFNAMNVAPYDLFPGPPDYGAPRVTAPLTVDVADVVAMLRASVGLLIFDAPY